MGPSDSIATALPAPVAEAPPPPVDLNDDMVDPPEVLAPGHPLSEPLQICRDTVAVAYRRFDAEARGKERHHRLITLGGALFGTAAVLLAILQLANLLPKEMLGPIEFGAAVLALASVALGLLGGRQAGWLLARHKSERFRLLKYSFLRDPSLWSGDRTSATLREDRLRHEVAEIENLSRHDLHRWIEADQIPDMPAAAPGAASDPASVRALADYYLQRRLRTQQEYFASRLHRNESHDRRTRSLPPLLFFASVAAAFAHFGYSRLGEYFGGYNYTLSSLLTVLAAGLAVIGAGLRTYRGAHEFSRNSTRFRAKLVALRHVGERLEHQTDPVAIYRELWYCEQILESEHREWLRLMSDAEWFG